MNRKSVTEMVEIAKDMQQRSVENLMRHGYLASVFAVFGTRTPQGVSEPSVGFFLVNWDSSNSAAHAAAMSQLREVAKRVDAFAIVYIMETWFSEIQRTRSPDEPLRLSSLPLPSEQPDRREAIYMHLEHEDLFGITMWRAEIVRDAAGMPRVLDFVQVDDGATEGASVYTRWAGLLPRCDVGAQA